MLDRLHPAGDNETADEKSDRLPSDLKGKRSVQTMAETEEKRSGGQIEITLERVKVGDVCWEVDICAHHGEDVDMDIDHGDRHVKHSAAREEAIVLNGKHYIVDYSPIEPDKPPFARFGFYHRDKDIMQRLRFVEPGAPRVSSVSIAGPSMMALSHRLRPGGERRKRDREVEEVSEALAKMAKPSGSSRDENREL